MGALMGGGVGLTIGFIFGSWSIIRYVNVMILKGTSSPPFLSQGWCRTARIHGNAVSIYVE